MPTNPTPTQQETLLPCPFDGGDQVVISSSSSNGPCVHCFFCDAYIFGDTVSECVEKWNTRRAAVAGPRGDALTLIAQERQRQISVEGYDANHDDGDGHDAGELAQAAAAYALGSGQITNIFEDRTIDIWPTSWGAEEDTIRRKPRIRQLVIAGALIVAEIERLQRSNGDTAATASPAPAESVVVAGRVVNISTHGEPTRARLQEIQTSVSNGYEREYRKFGWSKALEFAIRDLHFLLTFFRDDVTNAAAPADNDAELLLSDVTAAFVVTAIRLHALSNHERKWHDCLAEICCDNKELIRRARGE